MKQNLTICQDRKTNRQLSITNLSKDITNSCQIKRKISTSSTLTTTNIKKRFQIQETHLHDNNNNKQGGRYMLGWGKIPCLDGNNNNDLQIINKDISSFSIGQQHIVFMNTLGQVYGIGNNKYGQLGIKNHNDKNNVINKLFQESNVKKIYCTTFNTFIVNQNHELYGCGMNNRGQLGIGCLKQKVERLTFISALSQSNRDRQREDEVLKTNTSSRSKINSIFYQQQRRQHEINHNSKYLSLLQPKQSIIDIQGGPFHTAILTSKGRIFTTGNLYTSKSLQNDQYSTQFTQLNTQFLGKIIALKSSLTGICLLSIQNKLYLHGIFGIHIFNQPQILQTNNILTFDINQEGLYIIDTSSDLLFYNFDKDKLKQQKIYLNFKIKAVYCGLDYVLIINKQGNIYGKGDNSQKQITNSTITTYTSFHNLNLTLNEDQYNYLKCSNNFVITLTSKLPSFQHSKKDQIKNKDIERQNKILKQLLCNKNKKNVKIQTQKESRFDIVKPINSRTFDNSLEIPFQEIKLGKQISEGGYGIIYKATWRKSVVAVKIFKIEKENQNAIRDFVSQCHAMQALRHPNIVMFLGACTKPPHFAIVLEFCQEGTLWTLLQKQNFEITWQQRRHFALDIAKGMNYLHERSVPIIHRDLKSLNLLLDANKRIKLADFGWTKGLQNYMTGKIGTYQWMAPQVISAYQYTQKADIFSFGIILWEIASREAPYRNIPGPQVAQEVLLKDLRPIIPKKTPQQFSHLIQRCWNKDPSTRPSFNSIIQILETMTFH